MDEQDTNQQPQEGSAPEPEPATEAPTPRRLYRARRDRVIRGVGGGLGHYFNVDPIIFRIAFVALSFFGGAGIFLYLAFWAFVPTEGEAGAPAPYQSSTALSVAGVVALVIAAIALLAPFGGGGGWDWGWWWGGFLFPTLLIVAAGVLIWRHFEGRRRDAALTEGEGEQGEGRGVDAAWIAGRIALVVALVAGAFIVFFGSALAAAAGGGAAVAAIVVAIGVMLVVAAFRGGARWLILPALLMAFPVGVVSAADFDLDGGVGERQYRPATAADVRERYELGVGQIELDLRNVEFPQGDRSLRVEVGIGEALVVVPRDVCVALDARVGAGYARLLDRDSAGLDVDWGERPTAAAKLPRLLIDADVGLGDVQVVHDPNDARDHRGEGPFESQSVEDSGGNVACERGRGVAP